MIQKKFELLPHTADIKIRVYGASREELFRHALIGMFQSIGPRIPGSTIVNDMVVCETLPKKRSVAVQAPDIEALLVNFLSEALYLSDVYNEAYLDVDITVLDETQIEAMLHGIEVSGFEVVEIKAVTYHDLNIQLIDGVWQTDIVFDI